MARGKKSVTGRLFQLYLLLGAITVLLVIALLLFPALAGKPEPQPVAEEHPAEIVRPPEDAAAGSGKIVKVPPKKGAIVLVIDDAGHNMQDLLPLLEFPGAITFAVLPGLDYSVKAMKAIKNAGKEPILHQPMEALGGNDPGPDAVYTWMDEKAIRAQIAKNIDTLAGVRGINNHMGSRATSDPRVMKIVLGELKSRKMFFLDSRTSADTVGRKVAADMQLPFLERSVFLDNTQEREAIMFAFREGMKIAEKEGSVVMIGHVWTHELADVLMEVYPQALDEGFEFLSVTDLLDEVE